MKQAQDQERFDVAFIGLWPVAHKNEGLIVLLCDMIKSLAQDGVEVVVHTTDRHRGYVARALEGNGIDLQRVRLEIHHIGSVGLGWVYSLRHKTREGKSLAARLKEMFTPAVARAIDFTIWLLDITVTNALLKIPALVFAGVLGAIAALLLAVTSALAVVPLVIALLAQRLARRILPGLRQNRLARQLYFRAWRPARRSIGRIVPELYRLEQERFAQSLNRRARNRLIFFPSAFDGHAVKLIKSHTVVVFPDAVTALFPTRFAGAHNAHRLSAMSLALQHASGLVCYSTFVRDQQLLRHFGPLVAGKPVKVIPQGHFRPENGRQRSRSELAAALNSEAFRLKNFFPTLLREPPVVQFGEFDLILYPTIDRPHKNTATLVRALEYLLRRRHRNVKLLLTTPNLTPDVMSLIVSRRLHYDVLLMPSVPIETLDLLFEGASLMVHPSLAEGGDPFNFSRAVSVGVPALMADVAVVREMFDRKEIPKSLYRDWLFSPIDWEDLARKMEWALDTSARLVQQQRAALDRFSSDDFCRMARQYHEFCMEVAKT